VSDYFDLTRIVELQDALGPDAESILGSMLRSMAAAIEQIEPALAAGELDEATQAAHRARNDALMLSARPLQEALTELEAATRDYDSARAATALERVQDIWPPTRDELAASANPP
jgi:HPt (histidine-containing phosphotransfer) domain-containing protein